MQVFPLDKHLGQGRYPIRNTLKNHNRSTDLERSVVNTTQQACDAKMTSYDVDATSSLCNDVSAT